MVEYTCKSCKKNYGSVRDAEKCEEQGLIGSDIEPGLLLSHKEVKNGFKIFYGEVFPKGHERCYEFEDFLIWNNVVCPVQHYKQTASKFTEDLKKYNVATKEEIERTHALIKENFPGIGVIKVSMEVNNVKKIHNNLELKVA